MTVNTAGDSFKCIGDGKYSKKHKIKKLILFLDWFCSQNHGSRQRRRRRSVFATIAYFQDHI